LSAAVGVAVRDRGLPAVLLLGIASWLAFVTIIIPFQGHGWGYRYFHPYLGSFALLAGYGYRELRTIIGGKADGLVLASSAVTALVTIPLLLIAAHKFVEPYLAVERLVGAQRTPMVLIDDYPRATDGRTGNAIETVRNLPDLSNRPLRLSSRNLNADLLAELCRRGRITLVSSADQHRVGFALNGSQDNDRFAKLIQPVQQTMPYCLLPSVSVARPGLGAE